MNSFGFRVIAIVTLTFASICASVAKERWAIYSNPRFGTTADYPADLFTVLDPPPDPEREKAAWNSIVSRLSRSLRAVQVHELPN
jgi:hypothetical protein